MKLSSVMITEQVLIESVLDVLQTVSIDPTKYAKVITLLTLYYNFHNSAKRGIIELRSFYQTDDARLFELANVIRNKYPDEFDKLLNEISMLIKNKSIKNHINKLLAFFKGMENNADLKPKTKQVPSLPSKPVLQKSKMKI